MPHEQVTREEMMINRLRCKISQRKISLFRLQPWLWAVCAAIFSFGAVLLFSFILSISVYGIRSLLPLLVLAILLYIMIFIRYRINARSLLLEKKDRKQNSYTEETVVLISSQQMRKTRFPNIPDMISGTLFWEERASYHTCCYKNTAEQSKNRFHYILTEEKAKRFERFFGAEITYRDIGVWPKEIFFAREIPVKIVYGKNSRVLKEILPAENISYTEEQLNAFGILSKTTAESPIPSEKAYRNDMLSFPRIKAFLRKKDHSPLVFAPLFIGLCAIVLSASFISMLMFFGLLYSHEYRIPGLWILGFALIFFYFLVFSDGFFPLESAKREQIEHETVLLKSSRPLRRGNGFSRYLKIIFPDETPILQCVSVCPQKNSKKPSQKNLYWVLSQSKRQLLEDLYQYSIYHVCSYARIGGHSLIRTEISFEKGVPITVTFSRKTHELKSIAPAEGFDYTEEQLAAIEKFNTLYP